MPLPKSQGSICSLRTSRRLGKHEGNISKQKQTTNKHCRKGQLLHLPSQLGPRQSYSRPGGLVSSGLWTSVLPPEQRFPSGWGFLKWSKGSGGAAPQRSPSPLIVKEPSLQKDLGGSLLLTCYSTEKREDVGRGRGGTGEGGEGSFQVQRVYFA